MCYCPLKNVLTHAGDWPLSLHHQVDGCDMGVHAPHLHVRGRHIYISSSIFAWPSRFVHRSEYDLSDVIIKLSLMIFPGNIFIWPQYPAPPMSQVMVAIQFGLTLAPLWHGMARPWMQNVWLPLVISLLHRHWATPPLALVAPQSSTPSGWDRQD